MESSSLDLLFNILFLPVSFAFFLFVLFYLLIAIRRRPRPQRNFSPPAGPWPSGYLYRLLDEINFRNLFPAKNPALEIGIETGETSDQIFDNFEFLLGIERFKHFIPAFKDKTRWTHKIIGDATSLPFVPNSLVNIAAVSVFNNISKEQIVNVIKECARVLAPGGALVFTVWGPAILNVGLWGAFLSPLLPRRTRWALNHWTLCKADQHYFPFPELKNWLQESGLKIENILGYWDADTCRVWATIHYVFSGAWACCGLT
jgi:SAM-dependent methyltransferase